MTTGDEQREALLQDELGLLDVFLVIQDSVVEGLGIAGQTLGPERSDVPGDLGAKFLGVGHRGSLIRRIDVDRRGVELEVRPQLLDEKADDPARRSEHGKEIELYRNPG